MQTYADSQVTNQNFNNKQIPGRKALSSLKSEMFNMRSCMQKLLKSKCEQNVDMDFLMKPKLDNNNKETKRMQISENKIFSFQEMEKKLKTLQAENQMLRQIIKEMEQENQNQKQNQKQNYQLLQNHNLALQSKLMRTIEELQKVKESMKNTKKSSDKKTSKQRQNYESKADFEKLNPQVVIGFELKQSISYESLVKNLVSQNDNLLKRIQKGEQENNCLQFQVRIKEELVKTLNEIIMKKQMELLHNKIKCSLYLTQSL